MRTVAPGGLVRIWTIAGRAATTIMPPIVRRMATAATNPQITIGLGPGFRGLWACACGRGPWACDVDGREGADGGPDRGAATPPDFGVCITIVAKRLTHPGGTGRLSRLVPDGRLPTGGWLPVPLTGDPPRMAAAYAAR